MIYGEGGNDMANNSKNVNAVSKESMRSPVPFWVINIILGVVSGIIYKMLIFKYFGGIEDIALHEKAIKIALIIAGIIAGIIVSYDNSDKYEQAEEVFPVVLLALLTPLVSVGISVLAVIAISLLIVFLIGVAVVIVLPFLAFANTVSGANSINDYDDDYDDDDDYVYDAVGDWK